MLNVGMLSLKAKIKGLAVEGTRVGAKVRVASGLNRSSLRRCKKQLGTEARYYLVAYGLVGGKSYLQIERKVANQNKIDAAKLFSVMQEHLTWSEKKEWPLDRVEKLLAETPQEMLEGVSP